MGLTRPGGLAAGLGEDFAIDIADMPASNPNPAEPNRDLPPEIMSQLCAHLRLLTSPEIRTAVELAIDTGRRPEEICRAGLRTAWPATATACPVLIYDNHKANRPGAAAADHRAHRRGDPRPAAAGPRPLPRTRPIGQLKLLPTDRRNPAGGRAITACSLSVAHRAWVEPDAGAAHQRRRRVRQGQDRALRLPAHLRPAPRRRRCPVDVLRELM